ncbi:MAG: PHP domain-containing protein [Candidatus Omnitrophica bacterium]|nr:PHP domain-containing protein [Candidatus Omnitrophota bacterium]
MRYADLHVHTFYSDSTFSPEEVVACAKEKDLAGIAICDHDSTEGIEPCRRVAEGLGIEIIAGVEMTAEKPTTELHILGYFIDFTPAWFQTRLKVIRDSRVERIYKMAEKLAAYNIKVDPEKVFALAGKGSVGRLHMARALVSAGQVMSMQEVFNRYIGFGKPCYVPHARFTPREAIETILKVKGVPVLAHPNVSAADPYIEELVGYGLRGIEAYHTDHDSKTTKRYVALAEQNGLIVTGGSDCHGLGKGKVLMGGVKVPYEVVEALRAEATKIRGGG